MAPNENGVGLNDPQLGDPQPDPEPFPAPPVPPDTTSPVVPPTTSAPVATPTPLPTAAPNSLAPTVAPQATSTPTIAATPAPSIMSWITGSPTGVTNPPSTVAPTIGSTTLPPVTEAPSTMPSGIPCTPYTVQAGMVVDSYKSADGNRADPSIYMDSTQLYDPTGEILVVLSGQTTTLHLYSYISENGGSISLQTQHMDASPLTAVSPTSTPGTTAVASSGVLTVNIPAGYAQGLQKFYVTFTVAATCHVTSISMDLPEGTYLDYMYANELVTESQPLAPSAALVTEGGIQYLSIPAGEIYYIPPEDLACTDSVGYVVVTYLNNMSMGANEVDYGISLETQNGSYLWSNVNRCSRLIRMPVTGLYLRGGNGAPLLIYSVIKLKNITARMMSKDGDDETADEELSNHPLHVNLEAEALKFENSVKAGADIDYPRLICPAAPETKTMVDGAMIERWIATGRYINWSLRFARIPRTRMYEMHGDIGTPLHQIVRTKPGFVIGFKVDCPPLDITNTESNIPGYCYTRAGINPKVKAELAIIGPNPKLVDLFMHSLFTNMVEKGEIDLGTKFSKLNNHYGEPAEGEETKTLCDLLMTPDEWECTIGSFAERRFVFNDPNEYEMAAENHFGQHILSLRPLCTRMGDSVLVFGTTNATAGGLSSTTYRTNQYRASGGADDVPGISAKQFMTRSCLGLRGGHLIQMLARTSGDSSVTIEVKQSPVSGIDLGSTSDPQSGIAITDTRVNPLMIVKLPYREDQTFIYTRTKTGTPLSSNERLTRVVSFAPVSFSLQEWSAIADDQQFLNFIGSVPLRVKNA